MPGSPAELDAALALTRTLFERVEAGEFEAAATLESERRAHLELFFSGRPRAEALGPCVERLRELVAANETLVGLAEHLQRALAREAEALGSGRRALRAYGAALR
jgi:hypothetical protein